MDGRTGRAAGEGEITDPWGAAVAEFLADLLDNVDVAVHTDVPTDPAGGAGDRIPIVPVLGADGRTRQFSLRTSANAGGAYSAAGRFPDELSDLPAAALRALARATRSASSREFVHPGVARAVHDVIVAEVLADRLTRRMGDEEVLDDVAMLVAETLDYFAVLAATRLEGGPVCHGVVIAGDDCGWGPIVPPVPYPGRLPTRKRTPQLFDGTEWVLVVAASGQVLGGVSRESLPGLGAEPVGIEMFDEFPGIDGALTAAASAVFRGVGAYLRSDRSIWIFDDGQPLFIRRTSRWKSIAIESFTRALAVLGRTRNSTVAERVARAALRMSIHGQGALFAIASDPACLDGLVQPKDRYPARRIGPDHSGGVDNELHRLLSPDELTSSGALVRLARIDGATIVDTSGAVLAYGAIVASTDSRGEGARTAAARALSMRMNVALSVSQDGPITMFHDGQVALEML